VRLRCFLFFWMYLTMGYKIIQALWGDLKGNELKKYGLLGLGFFFLIGSWWPLKTLKDSIFVNTVGPLNLPLAKFASVCLFFPIVLLYSKLIDVYSKEKLIYFFITVYMTIGLILVYYLAHPTIGLANTQLDPTRLLGWLFYLFTESYISLMLSLYWSFINDITTPESAKRGYSLIIFGTQLGGFLFTLVGYYVSHDPTLYTSRAPMLALISVLLFSVLGVIVYILEHVIGRENLVSYEERVKPDEAPVKPEERNIRFLDGLVTLITHPYVAGIFILIFFQEIVTTMMGFQLSLLAKSTYQVPGLVNKFFFDFALCVQTIACIFSLVGTSFFQRKMGMRFCLVSYPAFLGIFIVAYMIHPTLQTIFYVMLMAKALGYALNRPATEMLYIPTSKNIKYKSKAWIEMFGLRFAKASGSMLNRVIGPVVLLTGSIALISIAMWTLLANKLGKVFKKAVTNKEIIE